MFFDLHLSMGALMYHYFVTDTAFISLTRFQSLFVIVSYALAVEGIGFIFLLFGYPRTTEALDRIVLRAQS